MVRIKIAALLSFETKTDFSFKGNENGRKLNLPVGVVNCEVSLISLRKEIAGLRGLFCTLYKRLNLWSCEIVHKKVTAPSIVSRFFLP